MERLPGLVMLATFQATQPFRGAFHLVSLFKGGQVSLIALKAIQILFPLVLA
jgi:hypothetical protein